MEELNKTDESKERDIVFSRTIKAGKRIYYVDVKRNRKDEMYLAITESKKVVENPDPANMKVSFEKHKLFIYREDFEKFKTSINEAISFIEEQQGKAEQRPEGDDAEIKIDLDF